MLGQEPAVLARCCTASRPKGSTLASKGNEKAGKGRSHPQRLGNTICFLPNLHRRRWEGEKAFALLDRGWYHTTVLQRKYSLSTLSLKTATGVRWIEGFRFYWLTMTLS